MCATCGCAEGAATRVVGEHDHGHGHGHDHGHDHDHDHGHGYDHGHTLGPDPEPARLLKLEQDVLAKNNLLAARNRAWLEAQGVVALNLMSAPGSGKTTLLEATARALDAPLYVIEGDQETSRDAERIRAAGGQVVQVNTGTGCHLDAAMVSRALDRLAPPPGSVLVIENVGNLVCPALFDLGEKARVVIASVTEGEDKPLKYPHMFRNADLLLLNKVDLLPHLAFDVERCLLWARQVNPRLEVMPVSALGGQGLAPWLEWLRAGAAPPARA